MVNAMGGVADSGAGDADEAEMFDAAVSGESDSVTDTDSGERFEDQSSTTSVEEQAEPDLSGPARDPATGQFVAQQDATSEPSESASDDETEATGAIPEGDAQAEDESRMHGAAAQVPSWRLAEETTRRREAEAAAVQLAETVNALQAQMSHVHQLQQGQVAPSAQAEGSADPANPSSEPSVQADGSVDPANPSSEPSVQADRSVDPAALSAAEPADIREDVHSQIAQGIQTMRLENSLTRAQDRYSEPVFGEAYLHLMSAAGRGDAASYMRVMGSPDPGEAIMQWHNEQKLLHETGGDPSAYRQRIAGELKSDPAFRKEVLDALRAEAQGNAGPAHQGNTSQTQAPNTVTEVPPSLSTLPGGGGSPHPGGPDGAYDEEALFKQAIGRPLRGSSF